MDSIKSIKIYFGDSGRWSDNALQDAACLLHTRGLRNAGHFRHGEWVGSNASAALPKVDVGAPVRAQRFSLFYTPELEQVGQCMRDCDFSSYAYVSGVRALVAGGPIPALPLRPATGARLLNGDHRSHPFANARSVLRNTPYVGGSVTITT